MVGSGRNGRRRAAGELESQVMTALWAAGRPLTPAQVVDRLPGGLAHTTVLTILSRLLEKGRVTREKSGRGHAYTPVRDEASHVAEGMFELLDSGSDRRAVLARFISELPDEDEEVLLELLRHSEEG